MEDRVVLPAGLTSAAPAPRTPPRTWEELFPRRPKPADAPYGFLSARGEPVPSTQPRLLHLARTRALPSLVWTPETAEMVPPWEVPYLLEVMRAPVVEKARRELGIVQVVLMVFGVLAALLLAGAGPWTLLIIAPIAALLGLLAWLVRRRVKQAERLDADDVRQGFDAVMEQQAEAAIPVPATRRVALSLIAVGICQLLMKDASIEAGGVSRQAVAAGEWWRLLTAPVLHGGILHFWMNYGALESLGRTMETRGVRAYVPLVFVAAALAGGLCSILLPPESLSVGASAGLMGMFGFLGVMAWRRKEHLPEGFLRALMINVAVIALIGGIAYRFIDNAAHAGGLAAGALIGLVAIPHGYAEWVETPALVRAGWAAQGVIFISAALAIALTLLAAFG
jgi:membrane associated rhomboid family serine protease